jgi:hypothetical protein
VSQTFWMLRNMLHVYDLAKSELPDAAAGEK